MCNNGRNKKGLAPFLYLSHIEPRARAWRWLSMRCISFATWFAMAHSSIPGAALMLIVTCIGAEGCVAIGCAAIGARVSTCTGAAVATLMPKPRIFCVPKYDSQDVTTELLGVAQKLNGFVYASCYGCNTKEQAVQYRRQFSQRELMLIFGDFLSFNPNTQQTEVDYAVVRAAAMRAYQDKEFGWHTSISNKGLNGVTGVTKPLSFDINDSATDVNYLNEQGITACINYNGYKFWGLRTCSADKLFIYENYTRTAQVLKDTIAQSFDWAVDKDISVNLVKEIVEAINAKWREYTAKGYLVGGKAYVKRELNTAATLKDAKLLIGYDYAPVPPLEQLGFEQRVSDEYLVELANNIAKVGA